MNNILLKINIVLVSIVVLVATCEVIYDIKFDFIIGICTLLSILDLMILIIWDAFN